MDAFARWMGRRRLTVADLDERVVAAFVDARQPRWRAQRAGATVRRLLMYFRAQGVIGPLPAIVDDSLLTQLAGRYQHYLCAERGLAATTVQTYLGFFKQFLCERLDPAATSVTSLRAGDVAAFVRRHARAASPGRAKMMVTALRAMFRFFFQHGELDVDFSVVVPTVPDWRLASIPRLISPPEIERLIAACDAETAAGRRDRAIVLLLARLGLRAGEVVALELDDLHWRTGEITIRGKKGLRHDRFPLPVEVGTALAAYLRRDRAPGVTRRVFLGMRAPLRGFAGPGAVTTIVRRASRADLHRRFAEHICFGTALRPTCSAMGRRSARSVKCCAIAARAIPRSTRKSTWMRSVRWRSLGRRRAVRDDGPRERCG